MKKEQSENKDLSNLSSIPVVSYQYWSILLILGFIFLALILWVFFGSIPVTIQGKGIFVSSGGLATIQAKIEGTVQQLNVHAGEEVKKGYPLLQIYDPQLELRLADSETRVELFKGELLKLQEEIKKEKEANDKALLAKLSSTQFNILQLKAQINFLTDELKEHKILLEKGLISGTIYHKEEQLLVEKQIDLEDKLSALDELISLSKKEYRTEELRTKEQQLLDETAQRDLLLVSLEQSQIVSPYDAQILEIKVNPGDRVMPGTQLVWLEKKSLPENTNGIPLIYAYFPIETGERIKLKTPVETFVPQINENEYGGIKGTIISISKYAVSLDNIDKRIQNRSIAETLMGRNSAAVEVVVMPERLSADSSQFKWTSGIQPTIPLTNGTLVDVAATIENVRPVYYLLPLQLFKYRENDRKKQKI